MIWVILILGLILRLISLNQSLWLDEAINTLAVKNYSLFNLVFQYAIADFHPPGWIIVLWFWTKLFGYQEIFVRIPSVIFGSLTVLTTYLIGKKLVSEKAGIIAALLISLNPLHIYYSQEARMYSMATLAVTINILLLLRLVKGERLNLIFLILSNIFVLSSDYLAYFIFPAQLIFLILCKRGAIKKWLLALSIAVLSGIWWVPVFLNQLDVGAVASSKLPAWKFIVGGFEYKNVPLTFVKFIIGRISLTDKFLYALIMLPLCSLFAFLLLRGFKVSERANKILIVSWIIIPVLLATIISTIVPIYSYFRVLFIVPGFIILTTLGILSFKGRAQNIFLIAIILIETSSAFLYLFNSSFRREDWKGAVNFLKTQKDQIILFESSGSFPPFDYYAKDKINAKGALKDFPAKKVDDVAELNNLIQQSKNIFLFEYLIHISDPQRFVESKLDELGYKRIQTINFRGVGFVHHYIKNE